MTETNSQALSTSLLLVRLGGVATTPLSEQQLVERLHQAASDVGCRAPDLVTAVYVGLKLHLRICVCGPARDRTMTLFDALVARIVGPDSEQTLHLRGPIGGDAMTQRFAALRIGDFVGLVLDPSAQGKAWFLTIDTPGDPTPILRWVEREIAATMQAHGRPGGVLPHNLFVLVAAGERPSQHERCWLALRAPEWAEHVVPSRPADPPPVGYQRQLLDSQLTAPVYRQRLRRGVAALDRTAPAAEIGLAPAMIGRWLAASVDAQQRGLWTAGDPQANARQALHALLPGGIAQPGGGERPVPATSSSARCEGVRQS